MDSNPLFEQTAREHLVYNEPPTGPIPLIELSTFRRDDGALYVRVDPAEFDREEH